NAATAPRPRPRLACRARDSAGVALFFQAGDGIRDSSVTGVQTCALPIWRGRRCPRSSRSASLTSRASRTLLAFLVAVDVGHHYGAPGAISAGGVAEIEFNLELADEVKRDRKSVRVGLECRWRSESGVSGG